MGKQSYSSVLSFWQTIHTPILGFVTPAAKNAEMFPYFPAELLAFYSQDWRVRGRRFIKIYFGLKPKFEPLPEKKNPCCLHCREECRSPATPSRRVVLIGAVHHLNLDAQLVRSVTDEPFIHLY